MHRAKFAVLICLVDCIWGGAQAQIAALPAVSGQVSAAESDPEDAFLSTSRYTNAYFGFEFEFPPNAKLKPIPMPSPLDRRTQLLEMVGPSPQHALVSIAAFEYKGKNWTDAKGILRRDLDQELYTGVEELHGLSKTVIAGQQFYSFETRKGESQHVELATESNGYVLLVVLQANDPKTLKDLTAAFYRVKFFPPQEVRQHVGPEAVAYEGPAVSAQRLRELKEAPPAEKMDRGNIKGNTYRNAQIGFVYEFPQGWSLQPQGAVEPAVEKYREKVSGEPTMGPRERAVVKSCRRTLLSAWKSKPGADGQVPYEDFGEVTLSAMPLSCFPNIRFPDSPKDADGIRRFLLGYSYTESIQRDMRDARAFEADGKTFVLTNGTIAYKEEGDALSRRISVATALTEHRGYLLVWLFAAPHDAELRELMNAKVAFDPDPTIKAGGGDAEGEAHDGTVVTQPVTTEEPKAAVTQPSTGAANKAEPTPAGSEVNANTAAPAPTSSAASRPTLLREGESAVSQQRQGKPSPSTKPN